MNIQARTRADIKRVGWSVIGVFASANSPTFAYTIGATETLEAPELLLFGLRGEYAAPILNSLNEKVRQSGQAFADGTVVDDVANLPCVIKDISQLAAEPWCVQALHLYDGTRLNPKFQMVVLPDQKGLFPWDAGYDETDGRMRKIQPELWKV
ncbi:DUF4262 domain-containing protein [Massilia sp. TN1-12]|uniref:DUF4262 domain-containing protein n=1 Tax=Massilia paldalensis TaxID=3377675 RepID=UPI00384B4DE2